MDLDQGHRSSWVTRAKAEVIDSPDRLGLYKNLNEVRVIDGYTHVG